jgi:cell division protease FtsH
MIDLEVQHIINESHAEATRLLRERRRELDALARALLERETLDEKDNSRSHRAAGGLSPLERF